MPTFCRKMGQSIKEQDMFGYSVVLNFNQQGETFRTSLGGVVSVILKLILSTYFLIQVKKMLNNEMDQLGLNQTLTNFDEVGRVPLRESGMIPFLRIIDGQTYKSKEYDPAVFRKFISMGAWKLKKKDGKETYGFELLKVCEKKDFPGAEEFFERLNNL